jgi:hypothetical protein
MTKERIPHDEDDPLGLTDAYSREDGSWECPLTGEIHSAEEVAEWDRHREQVRQQLVRECSQSPLYQARAAKDPNYWNEFYMGQVHLYKEDED